MVLGFHVPSGRNPKRTEGRPRSRARTGWLRASANVQRPQSRQAIRTSAEAARTRGRTTQRPPSKTRLLPTISSLKKAPKRKTKIDSVNIDYFEISLDCDSAHRHSVSQVSFREDCTLDREEIGSFSDIAISTTGYRSAIRLHSGR